MANENVVVSSRRPRRWLKWLAWLAGGFVVLLVVLYFVATSSAFFKGMILPRASRALNASITVSSASIHPFSEVTLRDVKVQPDGQAPLLTASEVRVRYHLWDIIGGNIRVDEAVLVSPTVELVENPDGSRNLDPILKALQTSSGTAAKPSSPAKSAKPLQLAVGKVVLSDANFRQLKNFGGGHSNLVEVANVNVTLANLMNGQTAKLDLAAGLRVEQNPPAGTAGSLAASFKGNFTCALGADLIPGQVSGGASLAVLSASGSFSNFDALGTTLNCDVTPAEIKQLALQFQKSGGSLGSLSVAGPFDAQKLAGQLTVKLDGIDRRLLNLAGAPGGLDFGATTVNATTEIQLAGGGTEIAVAGKFNAAQVQVTRAGQTTPVLDLAISYDVRLDRTAQTASVHSLDLTATQNGAPLLNAQLSSPMNLAWGANATNAGDAAFNLAVTQLNLADWKPFLGDAVSTGTVGLKLQVSSHDSGKQLTFDVQSDISNLAVQAGSNRISQAGINLSARGQLAQFKQVVLDAYKLEVTLKQQPALSLSGSGSYDLSTQDADLQVQLKAMLAVLAQAAPQAGLDISAGSLELNGRVGQKQKTQTVAGQLSLNDFSAQIGQNAFLNYSGKFDVDVANAPEKIQINKFAGSFSQNGNTGGSFEVAGGFKPGDKSADLAVKFAGLNAQALRPFLEPVLAGKTLSSVEISGDISGQYQPGASSAVKADLSVSNLVVKDSLQQLPATPLSAGFKLDVAINQQTADIHQFQIALTPTSRATNQLQFSGQVNFASPFQGNLKLSADSLDVTRYYDLFAGSTNTAKPAAASVAVNTNEEPAAVKLPVKNFTLAVELGRFYLHEVAITNFQTTVNLETSHVVVKPLQLSLNGAPVSASADVDLSVPGYKYDIAFDAQAVPLTPLLNTFVPARAGQMGGTVTASAQIKGAGFSGANLKKNLSGQFSFNATNLNLSMNNIKNPVLRLIVNAVCTLPEFLSNPVNAVTSLAGTATGQGGLTGNMEQSPIQSIAVQGTAGSGVVKLQPATMQSAVFKADTTGEIKLASVLNNSTVNLPVGLAVSQSVATQLSVSGTATNGYVALPQFLTITGTLGSPKADKKALVKNTIRAVGEKFLKGTNSPAANLMNQFFKSR